MRASCSAAFLGIFVSTCFTIRSTAQAATWDGGGVNSNWNNPTNWVNNVVPFNDGLETIFMAGSVNLAPSVNVPYDIRELRFDNNAAAFDVLGPATLTVRNAGIDNQSASAQKVSAPILLATDQTFASGWTSGATLEIAGPIDTNGHFISTSGEENLIISGPMSGAGGLNINGPTVSLSGASANTFTGATKVNFGTLELAKNAGITAIAGPLIIGDGTSIDTVRVMRSDQIADTSAVTINKSGLLTFEGASDAIGSLTMDGGTVNPLGNTLSLRGPLTATGGASIFSKLDLGAGSGAMIVNSANLPAADLTISAAISGAANIIKSGNGLLQFTGSEINTYTGNTTINAGTLVLNRTSSAGSIPGGTITIGDGINPATLSLAAPNQLGHVSLVINNSATLMGNNVANTNDLRGITMTGGSIVDANLEMIGNITTLASATPSTMSGGSLLMRETSPTFYIADGPAADDMIITAALTGLLGITKAGPGTLRLAGDSINTTTGSTVVINGTLILDKTVAGAAVRNYLSIGNSTDLANTAIVKFARPNQLDSNTQVNVNRSGRLEIIGQQAISLLAMGTGTVWIPAGSGIELFGDLSSTGGTITGGGTVSFMGQPRAISVSASLDIGATIGGTDITKTGAGILRLIGELARFTNHVFLQDGTLTLASNVTDGTVNSGLVVGDGLGTDILRLEASNQIANHTLTVNSSGTLDLNGQSDTINNLTITGGATVKTGTGSLSLTGKLTSHPGATFVSMLGNLNMQNLDEINVERGTASTDLNITANITAGSPHKTGPGILALLGNNSFSQFTLDAGTLTLYNNNTLGTGPLIINGGTLSPSGPRIIPNNIVLSGAATFDTGVPLNLTGVISGSASLIKKGLSTLTVPSSPILGNWTLTEGTLSAANLPIDPAGALTQNAGTFSGTLQNNGTYNYNGGQFQGALINNGVFNLSTYFSATSGSTIANITNNSTIAVGALALSSSSRLTNNSQITLAGGSVSASGYLTNPGTISGYGNLGSQGGNLTNTGLISQGNGNLTFAATSWQENDGQIDLASGRQLSLTGTALLNHGTINLNSSTINGPANLTNSQDGIIAGQGTIIAPFENAGGLLRLSGGTTNITKPFSSGGTIQLDGPLASLIGGKITTGGGNTFLQGNGSVGNDILNSGTIQPTGGTLILSGVVDNAGIITAATDNKALFTSGLASNTGQINLAGGTFDNNAHALDNNGRILGYGTFRASQFTNDGTITFSGGQSTINGDITNSPSRTIEVRYSPALFTGTITNNGIFKSASAQVTFSGTYIENGTFLSDPADNFFTDVSIGKNGAWAAGAGDRFFVAGDFLNQSTNPSVWDTTSAELHLITGGVGDTLQLPGADLGPTFDGYIDNYAWGTLSLAAGRSLTLIDGDNTPGGALYADYLDLAGGLSQINLITSNGLTLYYDLGNPANSYLGGKTWQLAGGGAIAPVPEPAICLNLLALALFARRTRRSARLWRRE
jgi:fibronectin-binding autotransporter adhesin